MCRKARRQMLSCTTEQTRLIRNLLHGFWFLPSSLLTIFLQGSGLGLFQCFYPRLCFFVSVLVVFCLKLSLGKFS